MSSTAGLAAMNAPFLAILELRQPSSFIADEVAEELKRQFPDLAGSIEIMGANVPGEAFLIKVGEDLVSVMQIDKPVPTGTFDMACSASLTWRDAKTALASHRAHVIVANISQRDGLAGTICAARSVTIVAAALAASTETIGVYWTQAETVMPTTSLKTSSAGLLQRKWPVPLWIGLVGYTGETVAGRQTIGVATRGLQAFLGREIEFQPAPSTLGEVAGRVASIAAYLLNVGPILKDGETMGLTEKEKIRIHCRDEAAGSSVPVWELIFETRDAVISSLAIQ